MTNFKYEDGVLIFVIGILLKIIFKLIDKFVDKKKDKEIAEIYNIVKQRDTSQVPLVYMPRDYLESQKQCVKILAEISQTQGNIFLIVNHLFKKD